MTPSNFVILSYLMLAFMFAVLVAKNARPSLVRRLAGATPRAVSKTRG
jgi:hypothetical protein